MIMIHIHNWTFAGDDKGSLIASMKEATSKNITTTKKQRMAADNNNQLQILKKKKRATMKNLKTARRAANEQILLDNDDEIEDVPPLPPPLPILRAAQQPTPTTYRLPFQDYESPTPTLVTSVYNLPALAINSYHSRATNTYNFPAPTLVTSGYTQPTFVTSTYNTAALVTYNTTALVSSAYTTAALVTSAYNTTGLVSSAYNTAPLVSSAYNTAALVTSAYNTPGPSLVASASNTPPATMPLDMMPDDEILNEVLNSFENQPTNIGTILRNMEREIHLIKQRLLTLEAVLPDIRNEEMGDQSAAVQLVLSDKRIGWKAAFRKLLILTFGVATLVPQEGKMQNQTKLDERKLQHLKGTYTFHNLTNLTTLYYLELIYSSYGGESDLTPQAINAVVNSACSVVRRTLKNMEC